MWDISPSQGRTLFAAGMVLLVVSFSVSLYSVPNTGDPLLPSFPFLELEFPLIPLMLVVSAVLFEAGWMTWRYSLWPVLTTALGLFMGGIFVAILSFMHPIVITVAGGTVFVYPYNVHASELVLVGLMLAIFAPIFKRAARARLQKPGSGKI